MPLQEDLGCSILVISDGERNRTALLAVCKKKEVIGVDLKEQGDEFHRNTKSVIINS